MILFFLSLLAGVLTVLAPCTISLLPVIVGGSVSGGNSFKRALAVTLSLGVSVIAFTLLLKVSSSLISIPPQFWQIVSGGIIFVLGLTMLFPALWDSLSIVGSINRSSNKLLATGYKKQSLVGDILVGAALGPVFSSCSPTYFLILATVLPRSLSEGVLYLLAYTVGLCGALLIVAVASQKILQRFGVASNPKGWLKRTVGIVFLLLGVAIIFGYDKKLELAVANNFFDVTKIEQRFFLTQPSVSLRPSPPNPETTTGVQTNVSAASSTSNSTMPVAVGQGASILSRAKAAMYPRAPEITKPSGYVNTNGQPITISEFKGKKVVLIDFWTYSCINCQRTLPYLKAWYDKYHDQGLEIISIHTPEFGFEKVQSNVETAVKGFGLKYPVVLDNDYGTWGAFSNQFWPRKYLIDLDGFIVYDHAGEGSYDVTEKAIQKALAERATILGTKIDVTSTVTPKDVVIPDMGKVGSPEIYFGSNRNEHLGNGQAGVVGTQTLSFPDSTSRNVLYFSGSWTFSPEFAESTANAKIRYRFLARDVYLVASSHMGASLRVRIDGKPVGSSAGADISSDGTMQVKENKLYKVIHLPDYSEHTLDIEIQSGTLDAYTFTFG